jgi:V/A-type H+-transporting ATPase subunit D
MHRADIPATKSNLLRLREHFGFVKSGHELLEQKREVLLEELTDMFREGQQLRREVEKALVAVYGGLRAALLAGGRSALEAEAVAKGSTHRLRLRERSVMGVVVPLLEHESTDAPRAVTAPGVTPPAGAATRQRVRQLVSLLVHLGEMEVSCRRLAAELQKTQRKVNALENIFIPEYRDTIHFIEGSLEEKEREALFQMKRLKSRRVARLQEDEA